MQIFKQSKFRKKSNDLLSPHKDMMSTHLENDTLYKKNDLSSNKRKSMIILGILLGLCLAYFVKSLFLNHVHEGPYTIGQDTQWKDLHLNGKERNLSAFNNELLRAIAKEQNLQIRLVPTTNLIGELQEGKMQGILTTLQSDYSNQHFLFSDPYFLVGPVLIIPSSSNKHEDQDKGKNIIGIPAKSPLLSGLEKDPSIHVKIYDDILTALAALNEREIDGAIFPAIPAHFFIENFYKHDLTIATAPLTDEGIHLATLNNERGKTLIESFNTGLEKLKEEGTYYKLLESWNLIDVEHVESNQQSSTQKQRL